MAAYSIGFELQSGRLYCGYDRAIRVFDIQKPGFCIRQWNTCGNFSYIHIQFFIINSLDRTKDAYQTGIISCLSFNPQIPGMYAAGSYAKTSR